MEKKWLTLIEIVISVTISAIFLWWFSIFFSSIVESFNEADFSGNIFLDWLEIEKKFDFIWDNYWKIAIKWNEPTWDFWLSYAFFTDDLEQYWTLVMWCSEDELITSQITTYWEYWLCFKDISDGEITSANTDINWFFSWLNIESFDKKMLGKIYGFKVNEILWASSEHLMFDIEILTWNINIEEKKWETLEKWKNFYLFNFAK